MANILLVDSDEMARRAFQGITTRGSHQCATAGNAEEAWRILREFVAIDLIVMELQLPGENGMHLLQRIRGDAFLKSIPVLIYTAISDQKVVRALLTLKVQNYLVKPYQEDHIFREIEKAMSNPWRNLHFEEERSFCAQMQIAEADLRGLRVALEAALEAGGKYFSEQAASDAPARAEVLRRMGELSDAAEAAGVWAVAEYVTSVRPKFEANDASVLKSIATDFAWLNQLIFDHLHPGELKVKDLGEADQDAVGEAQRKARWLETDVDRSGALLSAEQIEREIDQIVACPVIDTVLAGFQMSADKAGNLVQQTRDLVMRDPGLACAVLAAANQLEHDEMTAIEDISGAVSLLGSERLAALGRLIPTIRERHMNVPPVSWVQFWRFQVAVGRVARLTCEYLQFRNSAPVAYEAGLLHDIGKLLLLHLHPYGFEAMVRYARQRDLPLHAAEKKYMGRDTRELGDRFARRIGLPERYCSVIRFVEHPLDAGAGDVGELVAAVALARELCLHNRVGFCGDTPEDKTPPLEETQAWAAIQPRLFPGFKLQEFELQIHRLCRELRENLHADGK